MHGHLKAVQEAAVDRTLPEVKPITLTPQVQTLDEDLDDAAQVHMQAWSCLKVSHTPFNCQCTLAAAYPCQYSHHYSGYVCYGQLTSGELHCLLDIVPVQRSHGPPHMSHIPSFQIPEHLDTEVAGHTL